LTAVPADAFETAAKAAVLATKARGGHGAFREFVEWLLRLRGGLVAGVMTMTMTMVLLLATSCRGGAQSTTQSTSDERTRAKERVDDATSVVRDMLQSGRISPQLRGWARCVVIVPALVSGGLVLGARHGEGIVTCRVQKGWSAPAFVTITGGSAGFQIGVESADVVMLVKSERGMSQLFRSSFELGADTSAAAGPVGKAAQASTDQTMTAEIVSFARSRGLFAGVELSGAAMTQDRARAGALYGGSPDVHSILVGDVPAPEAVSGLLNEMREAFPPRGD
jgi:lipid-binding SYLF domain-containing protein